MTVPHGPLPSTLRMFLFGAHSVDAIADSFVEVSALDGLEERVAKRMGDDSLKGFRDRLAHAAAEFIDLDPAHLLADGLRRHPELSVVAEQTAASGRTALVPLGARRIALTQRPAIDVELDGTAVGTVDFELIITIDFADLSALVRSGTLVELEGERAELHAEFSVAGEVIAHGSVAFDANLAVPLDHGIRLAGAAGD